MSLPTAVFLDTSVLAGQQYNFGSAALTTFIPLAKKHGLSLLLPEPTESEIVRQIRERSKEALKALEDARRRAPFLAKWKHFPPTQKDYITDWEVMRVAMAEWQEFLRNFKVVKLDYSQVNLKTVMQWYDRVTPPFREGKKRKEFPDAFAIAIVEAYTRSTGSTIAVVSDDTDMKLACDRFPSLLYFKSLPTLTELLLSDNAKLEKLRQAVLNDIEVVAIAAADAASELDFYHSDRDYTILESKVQGVDIGEVNLVGIGDGECTLTFSCEVETEHHLEWEELDHYREEYSKESQWVLENSPLTGIAKVNIDPKTSEVSDVTFFQFEEGGIEISENPRRRW
jgi:predicted nucleic acid-binding protein